MLLIFSCRLLFCRLFILSVVFYLGKRPDYDRMDNDLKYRYIKMKGEATPNEISELENIFELNRDNVRIGMVREDVEAYEDAVRKQARLKEQAAKELDNKAKSSRTSPFRRTNHKNKPMATVKSSSDPPPWTAERARFIIK